MIEEDGQITLGAMCPVGCVAIANDDHNTLALLKRRDDESLTELLLRLDAAIHNALEQTPLPTRSTRRCHASGANRLTFLARRPPPDDY